MSYQGYLCYGYIIIIKKFRNRTLGHNKSDKEQEWLPFIYECVISYYFNEHDGNPYYKVSFADAYSVLTAVDEIT